MSGRRNPAFGGRNPWGSSVVPAAPLYYDVIPRPLAPCAPPKPGAPPPKGPPGVFG